MSTINYAHCSPFLLKYDVWLLTIVEIMTNLCVGKISKPFYLFINLIIFECPQKIQSVSNIFHTMLQFKNLDFLECFDDILKPIFV